MMTHNRARRVTTLGVCLALVGLAATLVMSILVARTNGFHPWTFAGRYSYVFRDLMGRVGNLQTLRRSGNIYEPFGVEAFTYPPGAILLFWPLVWLPTSWIPFLWTWLSVLCLAVSLTICLNRLSPRHWTTNFGVGCGFALASIVVMPLEVECLIWGQTATILLLFVVLDSLVVRGRARGILVGLATAFKIYPIVFIIMWLWRRQFREAITAIVTAAVTTAIAWILWPTSFSTFVRVLIIGHQEFGRFANGGAASYASSSITSFFMRAPFHAGLLNWAWDGVFSVLVIVLGLCASQKLWKMNCEISAMMCVLYASVLGSPVAWDHYFAFAPLLVLVIREVGLHSWLGRACLLALVDFCIPWLFIHNSLETSTYLAFRDFIARNAILLTSLMVLTSVFATSRSSIHDRFGYDERWRRRAVR
jgi:alpha-1,2-mannosyltransferase